MKKSLASLSIVSLLACTALTGCGEGYTYRDGYMLSFNGKDYTVEELFDHYNLKTSAGVKAYYDAVDNVAIEATIPTTTEMEKLVTSRIAQFKETAEQNASSNGTSYSEELEKSLESENVDDLEELGQKYLLTNKKDKRNSDYYSNENYAKMIPSFIKETAPYHVKHILVKVDATGTFGGKISSTNAKKLYSVVSRLASGNESFGTIAHDASDDNSGSTSSAALYGTLDPMTTKTGFVSEFKFGVYTYDHFFNDNTDNGSHNLPEDLFGDNYYQYASLLDGRAYGIPYSALTKINEYADVTTDDNGLEVEGAGEEYYPRNILFNNYLNNHGLSFIYLDDESATDPVLAASSRFQTTSIALKELTEDTANTSRKHLSKITNISNKKILCDEKGNPILVTRAGTGSGDSGYEGLHFIVIEKSPYARGQSEESLVKYYTIDDTIERVEDDPSTYTFINCVETSRADRSTRLANLKNKIKETDSNADLTIFKTTLNSAKELGMKLNNDIETQLNTYINSTIENTLEANDRSYNETWDNYYQLLKVFNDLAPKKVVPTSAIDAFLDGTDAFKTYIRERATTLN